LHITHNVPPVELGKERLRIHSKLLVNGFRLGFGNEFLKSWINPRDSGHPAEIGMRISMSSSRAAFASGRRSQTVSRGTL
jgi:hypothetical protein